MHVQICSQNQQFKQTLPSTLEKMDEETNNRHATNETEQLIEKTLVQQKTKCSPNSTRFSRDLLRNPEDP